MRNILLFIVIVLLLPFFEAKANAYPYNTVGRIVLQTEESGEAWYIYPDNLRRYYMGRPRDAFELMRKLGLGASHNFISQTEFFPDRVLGKILLDVEQNGEAYYINPLDKKKYYLARPSDAFRLMREFGLGITNSDLETIPLGNIWSAEIEDRPAELDLVFIDNDVPFVAQAPFGDWADQRQQDGCEESSALMAVSWARGESLSNEDALAEILAISDYELDKYGEYRDISSQDVVDWIFKDYLDYYNVELKKDISKEDIIKDLAEGYVIVAPMNGRLLGNPYFTAPGPPRHMLVIKGYDAVSKEFITNDPGTRHGADYRYEEDILYASIRDYPTGYHEFIREIEKNIIVVKKIK